MRKARNLRKLAQRYSELAMTDVMRFRHEWDKRVQGWLYEIQNRAQRLRRSEQVAVWAFFSEEGLSVEQKAEQLGIFDLYCHADNLLKACGKEVERLVGAETRAILSAECSKAVASIFDKRLYKVVQFSRMKK